MVEETPHQIAAPAQNSPIDIFTRIAESISEGIVLLNTAENIVFINRAACRMLGVSADEALGTSFQYESVQGELTVTECYPGSGGEKRFIAVYREFPSPALPGTTLLRLNDITRDHEQTQALRTSEMLHRSLVGKSRDGMFVILDEVVVFANEMLAQMLGYDSAEDLLGTPVSSVIDAADLPKARENYRKRVNGEPAPNRYELRLLHKDGRTIVPIEINATQFNYNGRLSSLGTVRDLSATRKADETIRWKEALLEAVVRDNPLAIYIVDFRSNQIQYSNRKFLDLWNFGQLAERITSKQVDDAELFPHMLSAVRNVRQFKTSRNALRDVANTATTDELIELVDGRTIRCISSQVRDNNNLHIGRMFIYEDITSRINAENELWKAKEKAEMSEQLKDAFIGNMSHEIRTPLNIIVGYTELLKSEIESGGLSGQSRVFESIATAGARLIRTVEHIMNISSIEAGAFPLHLVYFDLNDVLQPAGKRFEAMALAKGLSFNVNAQEGPLYMHADKYCIEQAVTNVIENAIKFTERGSVSIALKEDSGFVSLKVHDTGIGIAAEYLPQVFRTFSQEEHGIQRPYEGLGLGMRLTKYYVDANGGALDIWSNKGTGSTVTMKFPISKPKTAQLHSLAPAFDDKNRAEILIVEDDETTQKFLKLLLTKRYNLRFAASAEQAMIVLQEHRIDAILMDLSLHGDVDGIELTRRLKKSPAFAHIPIIATTAHANANTRQLSFDAGCDEFLIKPLDIDTLPMIIDQHVSQKSAARSSTT